MEIEALRHLGKGPWMREFRKTTSLIHQKLAALIRLNFYTKKHMHSRDTVLPPQDTETLRQSSILLPPQNAQLDNQLWNHLPLIIRKFSLPSITSIERRKSRKRIHSKKSKYSSMKHQFTLRASQGQVLPTKNQQMPLNSTIPWQGQWNLQPSKAPVCSPLSWI